MSTYALIDGKYQKIDNLGKYKSNLYKKDSFSKKSYVPNKKKLKVKKLKYKQNNKIRSNSPAEERIVLILKSCNVKFLREVEFEGLENTLGNKYRMDFYIPRLRMAIEYDGLDYHSNSEVKKRDNFKTLFCKKNNIKLLRLNKKHWQDLDLYIIKAIQSRKGNKKAAS